MLLARVLLCAVLSTQRGGDAYEPQITVQNQTDEAAEFWIRAYARGRRWRVLKLGPGETKVVNLRSSDPFDVRICRYHEGQWTIDEALGTYLKWASVNGPKIHTMSLHRSFAKPAPKGGARPKYVHAGPSTARVDSDGGGLFLPIEFLDSGPRSRYQSLR